MGMFDTVDTDALDGEHGDPDCRWVQFRIRFSNGRVHDIREIQHRPILFDSSPSSGDEARPEDQSKR
jgi:hypothetical protein